MFRALAAFAAVLVLGACQAPQREAPLPGPDEISIQEPGPELPAKYAAFLGKWHGRWGGTLDGYLVVEEVDPPAAHVIYAWGTNRNVDQAGYEELDAEFRDGSLYLPLNLERGITVTYTMNEDGTLHGVYTRSYRDIRSEGTFRKVEM